MKKPLISFSRDISLISIIGAILITLLVCALFKEELTLFGLISATFLALQSNLFWSSFGNYFADNKNKILDFFQVYFFTSFCYLMSFVIAIVCLFYFKDSSSIGMGWSIGIIFPFILRFIYALRVGFEVIRDIDLPQED